MNIYEGEKLGRAIHEDLIRQGEGERKSNVAARMSGRGRRKWASRLLSFFLV